MECYGNLSALICQKYSEEDDENKKYVTLCHARYLKGLPE